MIAAFTSVATSYSSSLVGEVAARMSARSEGGQDEIARVGAASFDRSRSGTPPLSNSPPQGGREQVAPCRH
jgi:hypothetical protein